MVKRTMYKCTSLLSVFMITSVNGFTENVSDQIYAQKYNDRNKQKSLLHHYHVYVYDWRRAMAERSELCWEVR